MAAIKKVCMLLIMFVFFYSSSLSPIGTKTVIIPDDIAEEENIAEEILVRNLSEVEIYEYFSIFVLDEHIYITNMKPTEIVKLSLNGKLLKRAGKKGQGPGEYYLIGGIKKFADNIAVLDYGRRALIFCTKDLIYLREFKLKAHYMDFLVKRDNTFVFFGGGTGDFYFASYTADLSHTEKFASKKTSASERIKKKLFDDIRVALYVPEENGIWTSFKNRYDLRYYKDQTFSLEIKAENGFFPVEEEDYGGRIVAMCKDARAICLAQSDDRLFYFFRKKKRLFCDIYDTKNHRLVRRVKLKYDHRKISHYRKNKFYSLCLDSQENDVQLFKIEFQDHTIK